MNKNIHAGKVGTFNSWTIEYKGREIFGYCLAHHLECESKLSR